MSSSGVNLEKYLIPLDEISRATENFSYKRYIGGGGFGSVYKGQLSERWQNQTVAVKRLDADSCQGECEFRNELDLLSRFHHENIVAFIGYCDEGGEMIIVYEYALNGSLEQHLRDPNKLNSITWEKRLKICIGTAKGLYHLHSGLEEQKRVIHRDVKSANILLDGNMVAKISDFGLSKLSRRNQPDTRLYTKVAGTHSYLDPTYLESGILQKESDVYSFGVVLFEVVSGMLVNRERRIGDKRPSLMNIVRRYHQMETHKVIDPYIRDQISYLSFDIFKEIAYLCISFNLRERPTLDTVIKKLEEALTFQMCVHSTSTPGAEHLSLLVKLTSVGPYEQRMACGEICMLTKHCHGCRVVFGKAGAIPQLTYMLTVQDSNIQQQALTALYNLSRDSDNRGIFISSGAVPGIVHLLEKGSGEAREYAAKIIDELSYSYGAKGTMGSAGVIPPLVLLLSEGTETGKSNAAKCLNNLCIDYDNKERAVTAHLVPILMELLIKPQGVLKERTVDLLAKLSEHPEGKLAIGEAEAVPHLVEFLGNGSSHCQEDAVAVLLNLCSLDQKYLVEAQEHGVMGKLKDVQQHGTCRRKRMARLLERMIEDNQHVESGSHAEIRILSRARNLMLGQKFDAHSNCQKRPPPNFKIYDNITNSYL